MAKYPNVPAIGPSAIQQALAQQLSTNPYAMGHMQYADLQNDQYNQQQLDAYGGAVNKIAETELAGQKTGLLTEVIKNMQHRDQMSPEANAAINEQAGLPVNRSHLQQLADTMFGQRRAENNETTAQAALHRANASIAGQPEVTYSFDDPYNNSIQFTGPNGPALEQAVDQRPAAYKTGAGHVGSGPKLRIAPGPNAPAMADPVAEGNTSVQPAPVSQAEELLGPRQELAAVSGAHQIVQQHMRSLGYHPSVDAHPKSFIAFGRPTVVVAFDPEGADGPVQGSPMFYVLDIETGMMLDKQGNPTNDATTAMFSPGEVNNAVESRH